MSDLAGQLFASMQNFYSTCDTYADDGAETTSCTATSAGQKIFHVSGGIFRTKFVRDQLFTFDWRSSGLMYWSADPISMSVIAGDITITHGTDEPQYYFGIDRAFARFPEISLVAALLMKAGWGTHWMKLPLRFSTVGVETIGGIECHIVEAMAIGTTRRLWIGRERPLLLQCEYTMPTPRGMIDRLSFEGPVTKMQTFAPIAEPTELQEPQEG